MPELANKGQAPNFVINEDIMSTEVRVIGEMNDDPNNRVVEEMNVVMLTKDALMRAREKGLDLVLIAENKDPPLVKIVDVGKYAWEEKKKEKKAAQDSKMPKLKEVKLSYTIGDHDLNTRINMMEKWLKNKRQQVRVTVVMKGRSRMFEKQARDILVRLREKVATFSTATGAKTGNTIRKDARGDLVMLLVQGADTELVQRTPSAQEDEADEEAEAPAAKKAKGGDAEEEDPEEIAEIKAEMEEMRKELLDCGIAAGQINQQPEMVDLMAELNEAKAKLGLSALGGAGRSWSCWSGVGAGATLAGAAVLAALRRPQRSRRVAPGATR
mmetsp:Transcript_108777/g.340374  ORF Transcript_108777/g.340374 Transcript_108777/m.340374 type:complete len:327 (+) Transcript_108777:3-983(+)